MDIINATGFQQAAKYCYELEREIALLPPGSIAVKKVKGRMMEDIVLLETKLANSKKEVFQLQFAVGMSFIAATGPSLTAFSI